MRLRTRLTVVAALAIVASISIAAVVVYAAEGADLRRQVDADLALRSSEIAGDIVETGDPDAALRPRFGSQIAYAQVVSPSGEIIQLAPGTPEIPFDPRAGEVAAGERSRYLVTTELDGVDLRVLTIPLGQGAALQVARPIEELGVHFLRMSGVLTAVLLAGVGLSLLLGKLVANASLTPLSRFISTTEKVATTRDPGHRIEMGGGGELDRLAKSINDMLAALDESRQAQRALVADASHELQTPLTSLRTDLEVMARADQLSPEQRANLSREILEQVDDLSLLVANLVDLGREPSGENERIVVELDQVVTEAVAWAERMHDDVRFDVRGTPVRFRADPDAVRRMMRNLLDNAARWNSNHRPVVVELTSDRLSVRDFGPGIDPADADHLFDRFYRGRQPDDGRRAGLGLAIAAKVAQEHGWSISATNHPEGGAIFAVGLTGADSSPIPNGVLSESQVHPVQ